MRVGDCVAIVTGGASGLGEATVRHLISGGARAAILDIQVDKGKTLAKELGNDVIFISTDVTQEESVQAAINKVISVFGKMNVVINCAGGTIAEKVISKKGLLSLTNFNWVLQLNLVGTINVIRFAAEKMIKNIPNEEGERGVIVNTSSAAAFDGEIGQAAYSASKAGLIGMAIPITKEFAEYGIRVMTIAPGLFDTPMRASLPEKAFYAISKMLVFPKRPGKPSEFAQLTQHIIENSMLNGEVIILDGGLRMQTKLQ